MTIIEQFDSMRGRTTLLTGAGGAIGSAIALALASIGANLILVDKVDMDSIETRLSEFDVKVTSICADLESNEERQKVVSRVEKQIPALDVLINNAAFVGTSGLEGWNTSFDLQSVETWRRAIEVNLTAPFHLSRALAPLLKQSCSGSIINIGSIYGLYGPDLRLYEGTGMGNPAAYAASKGGLIQFTRWLATTLAPDIRANSISPGGVWRGQPEEFVRRYCDRTPLRRMANEDDFIGAVTFLASDMSRYVTGQNIAVDGGWGVW